MTDFPLSQLQTVCMDRVIKKLNGVSYLRLQQTCRIMSEFVSNRPGIAIFIDGFWDFEWQEMKNKTSYLYVDYFKEVLPHPHVNVKIHISNIESLRGMHLNVLRPPIEINDLFELFCTVLKTHNITCRGLVYTQLRKVTKEQYKKLLDISNPRRIVLDSIGSQLFEVLYSFKKLDIARLYMEATDVLTALPQFLSRIKDLTLCAKIQASETHGNCPVIQFVTVILTIICLDPLQYCRHIRIFGCWDGHPPPYEPFLQWCTKSHPDVEKPRVFRIDENGPDIFEWSLRRPNGSCDVKIFPNRLKIDYSASSK